MDDPVLFKVDVAHAFRNLRIGPAENLVSNGKRSCMWMSQLRSAGFMGWPRSSCVPMKLCSLRPNRTSNFTAILTR